MSPVSVVNIYKIKKLLQPKQKLSNKLSRNLLSELNSTRIIIIAENYTLIISLEP